MSTATASAVTRRLRRLAPCALLAMLAGSSLVGTARLHAASSVTPVSLSQIPLTVAIPAHPQVLFEIPNSQSVDGTLSGAIMTGSGSIGTGNAPNSSSPVSYAIPSGFTPPLNAGSGGVAPYTVSDAYGNLYDNSASRLNVAKQGINAILNSFAEYADFALMDYSVGSGVMQTSVYYMSPQNSGFTFTDTPGSADYVANPCYGANINAGDQYDQDCAALRQYYGEGHGVISRQYMIIGASSDDPDINDVLYGGSPSLCIAYGGTSPQTPYPPNTSLQQYVGGGIYVGYGAVDVGGCAGETGPTNAGYVPYSPEVMYASRGFGYCCGGAWTGGGNLVVGMQSSGVLPTSQSVAAVVAAFSTALAPETNNNGTGEIKAESLQSPIAALINGANQYFSSVNPPSSNGCTATRYVVLVTDGLPTQDLNGGNWPPLGTNSATGFSVSATFNTDGSLMSTNDQALTDTINALTALQAAHVKTYVIGLGAGVDPSVNLQASYTLTAMAVAGGTNSYFRATSPSDLTNDMQVILAQILAATQSTASATVNTTGLNTSSMVFQPSFDTSDINQDWTGDIKAYPIDASTGSVTSTLVWSAQAQLDTLSASGGSDTNRLIATWDPLANMGAGGGIPFRWTDGSPTQGIGATTLLGQELETNTADPNGQHALRYLRGDAYWEIDNHGQYRSRTHILADIVDSSPLYIGAVSGPYQVASYYAFEQTYQNREPVIYAGAGDGMLHAFSAATGKELFAYIPHGVYANLINLTSPYYNELHHFYVDGSAQASDVQFADGSWHTVLVGSERAGGTTLFGLDVTNPQTINTEDVLASKVLWEFSDANMGDSYSVPALARTAVNSTANNLGFTVFFGNGYDSPSQLPYLYAVNPQTGQSLPGTPINLCAQVPSVCNTGVANGLSSVVAVNDVGGVGAPATTLYAGDLQGNVWRINISNAESQLWSVSVLFHATDSSGTPGNPQPITTTPLVSLNPDFPRLYGTMVYIATGQLLGIPDLSSTQIQTMYGVYDPGNSNVTLTRSDLPTPQPMSYSKTDPALRLVTGTQIALPSENGWLVDFNLPPPLIPGFQPGAERMVTDPRIDGGAVIVTSVIPSENTCSSGDIAFLMEFNYAGGAFNNPQFNYQGTGPITSVLTPVNGMLLGNVYASAPVFSNFAGSTSATGGGVAFITLSSGGENGVGEAAVNGGGANNANAASNILSISQRGLGQQRFSWWEIQ